MTFEKVTPAMIGTLSFSISLSTIWFATSGLSWLSSRRTCTGTPPSRPPFRSTTSMKASYMSCPSEPCGPESSAMNPILIGCCAAAPADSNSVAAAAAANGFSAFMTPPRGEFVLLPGRFDQLRGARHGLRRIAGHVPAETLLLRRIEKHLAGEPTARRIEPGGHRPADHGDVGLRIAARRYPPHHAAAVVEIDVVVHHDHVFQPRHHRGRREAQRADDSRTQALRIDLQHADEVAAELGRAVQGAEQRE